AANTEVDRAGWGRRRPVRENGRFCNVGACAWDYTDVQRTGARVAAGLCAVQRTIGTHMETNTGRMLGILGRLGDKVLTLIAVALVGLGAYAVYRMGPEGRGAIWFFVTRSVIWTLIVVALPWSARLFVRRILAVGSNWAGVALLAVFTVIDAIAGLLLMGAWPGSGWGWLAALAALAAAGTYNYLVTEYLAEQAGG
ncbi:MAG: hypothetical protein AB1716_22470, partial [Planctomycetota bacterium]